MSHGDRMSCSDRRWGAAAHYELLQVEDEMQGLEHEGQQAW